MEAELASMMIEGKHNLITSHALFALSVSSSEVVENDARLAVMKMLIKHYLPVLTDLDLPDRSTATQSSAGGQATATGATAATNIKWLEICDKTQLSALERTIVKDMNRLAEEASALKAKLTLLLPQVL